MELTQNANEQELSEIDIDRLESLANLMGDYKEMQYTYTINAYYQILSRMKSLDFNSEAVQAVVEQLFCFLSECDTAKEIGEKYTPVFFSKFTAPFFLEGSDIGEINIATYGREGAEFIARAIAFFGGLVLGINKILNWCQITSGGRTYTCPTKLIDGKLVFHFKKEWHSVAEFVSDHAEELVSEGGKIFSRPFKK